MRGFSNETSLFESRLLSSFIRSRFEIDVILRRRRKQCVRRSCGQDERMNDQCQVLKEIVAAQHAILHSSVLGRRAGERSDPEQSVKDQPIGDQMQPCFFAISTSWRKQSVICRPSSSKQQLMRCLQLTRNLQFKCGIDLTNMEEEGRLWLDHCLPTFRQNS